jgi:bifunctional DNase/RNase
MIEVQVESIRVSLINQSRLVVLREMESSRFLTIWIGAFEADAITVGLQDNDVVRPLTHDLICNTIEQLGSSIVHVLISDLRDDTFIAELILDTPEGRQSVDARPSDAIAIAVRRELPIYVSESVIEQAGQEPAPDYEPEEVPAEPRPRRGTQTKASEGGLDIFRDFVESLDLDDLDDDLDGDAGKKKD